MSLSAAPTAAGPDRIVRNNFDLLRFIFAFMVVLSHSYALSGEAPLEILSKVVSTILAVKGFFIVSGYLIFRSYENARSLGDYAGKRVRRIYPAYGTVVLASVFLGAAVSTLPPGAYLSSGAVRYLAANLSFLNFLGPSLPGVFEGNPTSQVNSALWTLKIEVMFYAVVPFMVWICRRAGPGKTLAAFYVLSTVYFVVVGFHLRKTGDSRLVQLQNQLPGQLSYFIAGAVWHYYGAVLSRHWGFLVAGAVAAFGLMRAFPVEGVAALLEPVALGGIVLWAAFGLPYLGNFGKFGDFSYGIYIIHCPVLQTLIFLGVFHRHPWGGFGLGVLLVLALAVVCWHFVEKPFLKQSSHYVLAGASPRPAR